MRTQKVTQMKFMIDEMRLLKQKVLQVAMKRFRFKPATWQGCAVPYWLTLQVTP